MDCFPYQQLYLGSQLSLLDAVNLAKCAAARAHAMAGEPGQRFYREYRSALLWSTVAATFKISRFLDD